MLQEGIKEGSRRATKRTSKRTSKRVLTFSIHMHVRGNILKNVVDLNVNGIHDVGTSLIPLTGHH